MQSVDALCLEIGVVAELHKEILRALCDIYIFASKYCSIDVQNKYWRRGCIFGKNLSIFPSSSLPLSLSPYPPPPLPPPS